jgi:ATP-dependent Lon protease
MPIVGVSNPDEQITTGEETDESSPPIPEELPILPLRGVVVYPLMVLPLTVGQLRSVRLVDEAVVGDRLVGLVASKDPELDEPTPDEVYQVGTVALIHRLIKSPDGTLRIIVQGLERMHIVRWLTFCPKTKMSSPRR